MTCDDVLNNGLMFVDVYMWRLDSNLNYIYIYTWSDLNLNYLFFAGKSTIGAVLD